MFGYTLILFSFLWYAIDSDEIHWKYHGPTGPKYWAKYFPLCGKSRQSPVNIKVNKAVKKSFPPLKFRGFEKAKDDFKIRNSGHSIEFSSPFSKHFLSGGGLVTAAKYGLTRHQTMSYCPWTELSPLKDTLGGVYRPAQFHFHWGKNNFRGSEHLINGRSSPLELHIVHINNKYSTLDEAKGKKDGLAVLAVFFKIGSPNPAIERFGKFYKKIKFPDNSTTITGVPLLKLLPLDKSRFFRYKGSLTTPTCNEVVKWTIFQRKMSISKRQMSFFRRVYSDLKDKELMVDNFRPPQPLNDRDVYRSF